MYTGISRIRVTRRGAPLGSASSRANTRRRGTARQCPSSVGTRREYIFGKIYYPWPRRGRALSKITVQTLALARARETTGSREESISISGRFFSLSGLIPLALLAHEKICALGSDGRTDGRVNECTNDRAYEPSDERGKTGARKVRSRVEASPRLAARGIPRLRNSTPSAQPRTVSPVTIPMASGW